MHFDVLNQTNAQAPVLGSSQAMLQDQKEEIPTRPVTRDDLGDVFLRFGQEMVGPQVRFQILLEGQPRPLDPLIREDACRIGREALLNAFRHSEATQIELHIRYTPAGLHLVVHDNGKGISAQRLRAGCDGLSRMLKVAERIGGKLKLLSRLKAGTEILLFIPGEISFASQVTVCRACAFDNGIGV